MYMLTSFINNQVDGLRKYCYDSIGGYVVCSGINYYWLKLFKKIKTAECILSPFVACLQLKFFFVQKI